MLTRNFSISSCVCRPELCNNKDNSFLYVGKVPPFDKEVQRAIVEEIVISKGKENIQIPSGIQIGHESGQQASQE